MEKYLGVKLIEAEPSWRIDPMDESKEDGYAVIYEDGYESWSPKDVFEKAYRRIDNLTFGLAMEAMKLGNRVALPGWDGYLKLQIPDANSKMTSPYIYAVCEDGTVIPAVINQMDMWSENWYVVEQ